MYYATNVAVWKAQQACQPLRTTIELTYRCNFTCPHCYCVVPETSSERARELTTEQWYDVLRQLADLGALTVTITGGEPLLRPDFFDIARRARALRFGVRIFSNASLITDRKIEQIAALRPMSVDVSIYGASRNRYRDFTGAASHYDQSMRAIDRLTAAGVTVIAKLNVVKGLLNDFDEMVAFLEERKIRWFHNLKIVPKHDCRPTPYEQAVDRRAAQRFVSEHHFSIDENKTEPDDHLCNAARATLAISPYGEILPCFRYRIAGGALDDATIREVWEKSALFNRVRQTTLKDLKGCGSCGIKSSCSPCMALNHMMTGDPHVPYHAVCDHAALWQPYVRRYVPDSGSTKEIATHSPKQQESVARTGNSSRHLRQISGCAG